MNPSLTGILSGPPVSTNMPMNAPSSQSLNTSMSTTNVNMNQMQMQMDSHSQSSSGVAMSQPQMGRPSGPQAPKDLNAAYFCRLGQETVQEIVQKTLELFQHLKQMTPPNGTAIAIQNQDERKNKVREVLKGVEGHFGRLRKIHEKCNEACAGMEYIQIESLIPMKDDDAKVSLDDKKFASPNVKQLDKEHQELVQLLKLKNRQIKEVIDSLRSIVWEINHMLAMRKQ